MVCASKTLRHNHTIWLGEIVPSFNPDRPDAATFHAQAVVCHLSPKFKKYMLVIFYNFIYISSLSCIQYTNGLLLYINTNGYKEVIVLYMIHLIIYIVERHKLKHERHFTTNATTRSSEKM